MHEAEKVQKPAMVHIVDVADMKLTNNAGDRVVTNALGSCIGLAIFDPVELGGVSDDELQFSRDAGYAAGFFFFWVLCALCSGVTAFLVRTAPKRDAKHRKE